MVEPLHGCAYPGCAKEVPVKKIACLMHWFALPPAVSDLLYREYQTARLETPDFERRHRHQAVRELAIAWWVFDAKLEDGLERHRDHMDNAKHARIRSIAAGQGDPFVQLALPDVFEDGEALAPPVKGVS